MMASSTIDAPRSPRPRRLTTFATACEPTLHNCSPCPETVALVAFIGRAAGRHPHQILRVDREVRAPLDEQLERRLADQIILDSLEIRKKHLRGRVAHILLYFSKEVYHSEEFDLPLSRKEIAEYVGMTTENVIRTLSEFRKDGILKIYGKTILIVQMDTLKSIAEFG